MNRNAGRLISQLQARSHNDVCLTLHIRNGDEISNTDKGEQGRMTLVLVGQRDGFIHSTCPSFLPKCLNHHVLDTSPEIHISPVTVLVSLVSQLHVSCCLFFFKGLLYCSCLVIPPQTTCHSPANPCVTCPCSPSISQSLLLAIQPYVFYLCKLLTVLATLLLGNL